MPNHTAASAYCRVEVLESRLLFLAGELDPSFSVNGRLTTDIDGSHDVALAIAVDLKGRILVGGFTVSPDERRYGGALVRYKLDGTIDRAFGEGGSDGDGKVSFIGDKSASIASVAVQNDGKILIAGQYTLKQVSELNSAQNAFVARLGQNGKLDTTFGTEGIAVLEFPEIADQGSSGFFQDIAIQRDGRIVAVGTRERQLDRADFVIARFNARGRLDKTFSDNGWTSVDMGSKSDAARGVVLEEDGHIIVVGTGDNRITEDDTDLAVLRVDRFGERDSDFSADGRQFVSAGNAQTNYEDVGNDIALLNNGRIVVVGASANEGLIATLDTEGTVLKTYFPDNTRYQSVAIGTDQKIVAAGYVKIGAQDRFLITRLTPELLRDTASFTVFGFATAQLVDPTHWDRGFALAIQLNGDYVVAGEHAETDDSVNSDFGVVRFQAHADTAVTISGRVFVDNNGNGLRNSNDAGMAGVRMYLDQNRNSRYDADTELCTFTNGVGKYALSGLAAGTYYIRQQIGIGGFRRTAPEKSTYIANTAPGDQFGNVDFGNTRNILISGVVYIDNVQGPVLENFKVFIDKDDDGSLDEDERFAVTDSNGKWSFGNLRAGTYVVRVLRKGDIVPTDSGRKRVTLGAGEKRENLRLVVTNTEIDD